MDHPKYNFVTWRTSRHLRPFSASQRQREGLSFLDLPGEIRNMIYTFTFGFNYRYVPLPPSPKSASKKHEGFKLFTLCRQIGTEAGFLFANKTTVYIPISAKLDLQSMYQRILRGGVHTLKTWEKTIFSALADVKDLHLHLHMQSLSQTREREILFNLLMVIRALNIQFIGCEKRWGGKRRNIVVHLDHYYADDWNVEVPQQRCSIFNIIKQMGQIGSVDWSIRYYVHTGYTGLEPSEEWKTRRLQEFERLEKQCAPYDQITIRPEVRGEGEWESEEAALKAAAVKDITPISQYWSSYDDFYHGDEQKELRRLFQTSVAMRPSRQ